MYKRIVLKLSGEALAGEKGFGLDSERVIEITNEIVEVRALGVEVAIVVGGGNFFRGVAEQAKEMDRVSADNMGMLSTVINAIALQDAIEKHDVQCRVMTAVAMDQIAEPYIRRRAVRHLEKGRVVIFAAGIGNPFFSTDTAASLRAMEIKADVLMKATKVEGQAASLAERVSRRLGNDGALAVQHAAAAIRHQLDTTAAKLWADGHVTVGALWRLYAEYPYMPRLRDRAVLDAIEPPSTGPAAGYTVDDLARDLGIDPGDRAVRRAVSAYADAFTGGFWQETERAARERAR